MLNTLHLSSSGIDVWLKKTKKKKTCGCLFVRLSIYSPINQQYLSINVSVCLPICKSTYLLIHQPTCILSLCPHLRHCVCFCMCSCACISFHNLLIIFLHNNISEVLVMTVWISLLTDAGMDKRIVRCRDRENDKTVGEAVDRYVGR